MHVHTEYIQLLFSCNLVMRSYNNVRKIQNLQFSIHVQLRVVCASFENPLFGTCHVWGSAILEDPVQSTYGVIHNETQKHTQHSL